jgi:hypothetical protein
MVPRQSHDNVVRQLLTLLNYIHKVYEDHKDMFRKIRSEFPKEQIKIYEQAIRELQDLQQAVKKIQQEIVALKRTNNMMIRNYLNFVQQQREAINEHIRAAKQAAQQEAEREEEEEAKSRGLIARFTFFVKQKWTAWRGIEQELNDRFYMIVKTYLGQLKRWDFVFGALVGNEASSELADPLSVAYDDLDARITALQLLIQEAERMDAEVQKLKKRPVVAVSVIPPRQKITSGIAKVQQKPGVDSTQKTARKKPTEIPAQSVHDVWKKIVEISLSYRRVTTARLSPDGKKLAILSEDGKCELYWVPTGRLLYTLGAEDELFAAVDFVDDHTLIASERTRVDYEFRERICLFGYKSNKCKKIIIASGVIPQIEQALYNRSNQQLLILTYDKKVYIVDGKQANREKEVASGVSHMATDCSSGYSAAASYDFEKSEYKIMIWDAQNNSVKEIISDEVITALAINMHVKKIATATNSDAIKLWDFETGKVFKTLTSDVWQQDDAGTIIKVAEGHSGTIESLDFNNDGTLLLSASHDQTARVWDLKTGTSQVIQESKGSLMRYVQFNCMRDTALIVNQHAVSVWNREPLSKN